MWALVPAVVVAAAGTADAVARNVVLLSLDTLRADRLGSWGSARPTSPTLDAFARRGVSFERVITESSWTLPSHMTLMTGLHPTSHGVTLETRTLAPSVPTLAEILQAKGWATAAFTEGGLVAGHFGFDRGFDVWDDRSQDIRLTMYRGRRFVEHRDPEKPFFLFLHTYAIHCPYHPRDEYAARFRTRAEDAIETEDRCGNPHFNEMELTAGQVDYLSDQYDAGIRAADDQVRDLLRLLDEQGLRDETIVVIVSDHGEELWEHGQIGHERTLHIESLQVPLIIVAPGIEPRTVRGPAGLADVVPTLLELLGEEASGMEGASLVGAMRGAAGTGAARFSELDRHVRLRSVVRGDRHLIVDLDRGARDAFDLRNDPWERARLDSEAAGVADLEALLDAHVQGLSAPDAVPEHQLSPADIERLKALGYVD
jgi:arylsulfatase A-like enzyme